MIGASQYGAGGKQNSRTRALWRPVRALVICGKNSRSVFRILAKGLAEGGEHLFAFFFRQMAPSAVQGVLHIGDFHTCWYFLFQPLRARTKPASPASVPACPDERDDRRRWGICPLRAFAF